MLSNLIEKFQKALQGPTEQEKLDEFVTRQHPTSVGDVEYWINEYDRIQYRQRSANFIYNLH